MASAVIITFGGVFPNHGANRHPNFGEIVLQLHQFSKDDLPHGKRHPSNVGSLQHVGEFVLATLLVLPFHAGMQSTFHFSWPRALSIVTRCCCDRSRIFYLLKSCGCEFLAEHMVCNAFPISDVHRHAGVAMALRNILRSTWAKRTCIFARQLS